MDILLLLSYEFDGIVYAIAATLMLLFTLQLVVTIINHKKSACSFFGIIPFIFYQIFSIIISHIIYSASIDNKPEKNLCILGLIGLVYINSIVFLYLESIKKCFYIQKQKDLTELQLKLQVDYYEQMKKDQEETRALWHDISKHLNTMQSLIESNNNSAAKDCMKQVENAFKNVGNVVNVGNPIVSAILNYYITKMHYHNIEIETDIQIGKSLAIETADLSVIIGNTLENAIDECISMGHSPYKTTIFIRILQQNQMIFYEVENPLSTTPKKSCKPIHGYGLKNVQKCIDKYSGQMNIEIIDKNYHLEIQLNLPR